MSREIKFRVWDNVDYMSKPFTLHSLMGANRTEFTSECVVMQYTGLKDKSGNEIYEGDVLELKNQRGSLTGAMKWDETRNGWLQFEPLDRFEVIGNIYENPELIK